MSRTYKDQGARPHQPGGRWPQEIPFAYEPHAVPVTVADIDWQQFADDTLDHQPTAEERILQLLADDYDRHVSAEVNRADVRRMLRDKQPEFAAQLETAVGVAADGL